MKKYVYLIFIFFLLSLPALAQTGIVAGTVRDAKKQPLPGINVGLQGTSQGTSTDESGNFAIEDVTPGNYALVISGVGYEKQQRTITVNAGETIRADVQLSESTAQLQEVEIVGRTEQSYKNEVSFIGSKTATALKDVPQAVSYVTKEVMQDQQAFRTGDVVKNISGVNQFSGYDDFTLRGFRSSVQLINGLRAGDGFWKQPLVINLERVEVIKGPAAAIFGNTDPGGTINRVTKKPLDERRQAINFTTGSYNTYRATADFTGPMNESKTLLYRLNIGYENAESFRKLQFSKNIVIAPSISFVPNENTQVNFDLVYNSSKGRLDRGQPIFGATAGTDINSTPISFALGRADDYLDEENVFVTASLNHKFTDWLSFNASYLKYNYKEDLSEHRTSNQYARDSAGNEIPTLMQMQTIRRLSNRYNDNITTYFVSNLNTGALEHKLLLGYDYNQYTVPVGGSSQTARGYRNAANTAAINNYDPAKKANYLLDANGNPVPNVPHFDLTNPDYSISDASTYFNTSTATPASRYYAHGIYVQDQIKLGRLQVLLGLRQEYYTDVTNFDEPDESKAKQEALLPRLGAVFTLTSGINLYGTYTEGYMPQSSANLQNANVGGPFDPLISNMVEFGAKSEWLAGRLAVNVAAYQIEQNNVLVNANDPNNPDLLRQRGQERSRGVELDITGRILPNLSLIANYALNETIIAESTNESEIGTIKENAPRHQGGFWARYNLTGGALKGIGIGAGANFVSERNTFSPILKLPAYAVADVALYYTIDKFQISLNVYNLTNKTHWTGGYDFNRLYPGTPRNFLASVGYTF